MSSLRFALPLAALLFSACAAPSDDPADEGGDVGSSSDAVIGGTETFARPEVGAVWHGGGLCTGTLIRPNVVLTALHCTGIASDKDVRTAEPAFAFEIRKSATERRRFAVDRIHSIGTLADMDGSQRWRARDIALLRLTEDVPAALARPVGIATSWPWPGARVALVGFGCTSRVNGPNGHRPGTNTKREKDYNWTLGLAIGWSDTQDVCPGDSGGPLLDVARNAVLGTTSGYIGGDDAFGDVPANSAAVTATAARWWPRP
jgi:V8-like Glu-specific endopeptidase